jgi:hypothetical protein
MMNNIRCFTVMFVKQSAVEDGCDYEYMMTSLSHIPQSVANNCGSVFRTLICLKLYSLQKHFHYFLHIHVV